MRCCNTYVEEYLLLAFANTKLHKKGQENNLKLVVGLKLINSIEYRLESTEFLPIVLLVTLNN